MLLELLMAKWSLHPLMYRQTQHLENFLHYCHEDVAKKAALWTAIARTKAPGWRSLTASSPYVRLRISAAGWAVAQTRRE